MDVILAIIFALIFLVFVFLTRRTKTFKNFAVSDNSIGLFIIFMSFSATFIGPGFSMALVNQGHQTGYFYMIVASFYGIAKIIEGKYFAPIIRERFSNALSIGDIIAGEKSHNNKLLHITVGLISFGLVIGFSTVLSKAGGQVLNNIFAIPEPMGIIIMTSVVVLYAFFGGIKATILTDAFQFLLFTIIIIILFITFFLYDFGVEIATFELFQHTSSALSSISFFTILGLIITWFFGEMLIPPTINRILSTRSKIISKKGLIYSGIFMIIWLFIMLSIGMISKILHPEFDGSDQLLLIIAQKRLNFGLFGVFAVAIIAIVMSSQDSLINSASIISTNDIFNVIKPINDTKKLNVARIATLIVGVFSVIFAMYLPSILAGLLLIYSFWAPAILVPLFASIYKKRLSWLAAFLSILAGISTSLFWNKINLSEYVPTILAGLFFSAAVYYFVSLFSHKKKH